MSEVCHCPRANHRPRKKVHDFLTVGAAAPLMEAATVGLCFPDSYYEGLQAHYTHMRQLFCDGLRQFGLEFTEPQGAYYVMLDVSKYGVKAVQSDQGRALHPVLTSPDSLTSSTIFLLVPYPSGHHDRISRSPAGRRPSDRLPSRPLHNCRDQTLRGW